MKQINKQAAGFKFGKYRTRVLRTFGEVEHQGRKYRLLLVETRGQQEDERHEYLALRLYNSAGRFIKQLMIEPELSAAVAALFTVAAGGLQLAPRSI